jgi:prepilin-type N-terminal cleavage/methylation domain-containing protein
MSSANRRAGFTLIELLVAVVLTGILATILFQMIRGQTAFTQMQSAREEVDQNTRGALELISSELRAVPAAGIVTAGSDRITFRLPRVWGILCAPAEAGRAIAIFPPNVMPAEALNLDMAPNRSWGIAIQQPAPSTDYSAFLINGRYAAAATCDANLGQPLVGVNPVPATQGFTFSASLAPASAVGARVFIYETVTYDAAASSDAAIPGTWLRRSNGYRTPVQQPLAGPLDTRDGSGEPLKFRYFCNATELPASALATAAGRLAITSVEVQVGMMSRESTRSVQQSERDTQRIHLRNTGTVATCP